MAYKGVLEDIRKAIELKKPNQVPIFACSEEFDVRICGMVYNEYNRNADLMAKCQIEVIKKFDYDWAWLQVDDCIEFEPLGVGIKGEGNVLPATVDYLSPTQETLKNLRIPDFQKERRMPVLLQAIKKIKEELGDTICITGRTAAPFSSVALLYGITQTMMLMYDSPQLLKDTLDFFTELQIQWGKAQIEAGANAIWFGDCNASSHLISLKDYQEYAFPFARKAAQEYTKAGAFTFYHASEEKIPYLEVMANLGEGCALSVGPGIDIAEAKKAVGNKICLIGNIDPIKILLNGRPEQVEKETIRIMQIGRKNGGYLFNSGEMIPRDTPEENMRMMMQTARQYAQ